jgi:hypothetical protein
LIDDASLFYTTGATGTAVRFFPAATTSTFFSGAGGAAALPLDACGAAVFLVYYYYYSSLVVSSAAAACTSSYIFFLVSTFSFLLFLGYSTGAFLGGSSGSAGGGVPFLALPFLAAGGSTLLSSFFIPTFFLGLASSLTGIFVSCDGCIFIYLLSSSAFEAISTSITYFFGGIRAF